MRVDRDGGVRGRAPTGSQPRWRVVAAIARLATFAPARRR